MLTPGMDPRWGAGGCAPPIPKQIQAAAQGVCAVQPCAVQPCTPNLLQSLPAPPNYFGWIHAWLTYNKMS